MGRGMTNFDDDPTLAERAEGTLDGAEWETWAAAHPDAAAEILIAQRVRRLMIGLRDMEIQVPADFEVRLMERVRGDKTLIDLLDLGLSGLGRAIIELLDLLFGLLSAAGPQSAPLAA